MNRRAALLATAGWLAAGREFIAAAEVPTHGRRYSIAGLPQHDFSLQVSYEHGTLQPVECAGTVGFVVVPRGAIDARRRWVWVSNLFLAVIHNQRREPAHRFYVERLLARGFHVVGVDVGASCGSPAGALVYDAFYRQIVRDYRLHERARLIGQSNAGLIAYGFAFRYPRRVERVFGIFPATDLRSWPGLDRLANPARFTPAGLSYDLSRSDFEAQLPRLNPIDNLAPLVEAGVRVHHVHGTADDVVPLEPNSGEFARRYRAWGGSIELEVIDGGTHGAPAPAFFESRRGLDFLLAD